MRLPSGVGCVCVLTFKEEQMHFLTFLHSYVSLYVSDIFNRSSETTMLLPLYLPDRAACLSI